MYQLVSSKRFLGAIAALSILTASSAAMAASTPGTSFTVSITIAAGCSITTDLTAVDFSTHNGATPTKPTGQSKAASITCTNGTAYDFHVTSANTFKMLRANGTETIPYTMKLGTTTIGTDPITSNFSQKGNGSAQSHSFSFDIGTWSPPYAAGTYSDTVTLNLDF